MGRKRMASRRSWPEHLGMNSSGYLYYVHPKTKEKKGLGHDKAKAFTEARKANAVLAALEESKLVDWVSGVKEHTLKEWVPLYRAEWIEKTDPAASTLRNQKKYLERIEKATFSWMTLRSITTVHISGFLDLITSESGPRTAELIRTRLHDMFRMAETKGLIEVGRNPVSATDVPKWEVVRERLTLEGFLAAREKAPVWLQRAMNLALVSAQRREDLAAMLFADVKDGYLFVIQEKSKGKTRLQFDLNIRLAAVNLSIGEVIKDCRDLIVTPYVLHHTRTTPAAKIGDPIALNGLSNGFQRARDAAGIKAAPGRTPPSFHEIRSLAERLYKKEYGAEFAQAMLGHKNAKMTATYDDLRGSGWQIVSK